MLPVGTNELPAIAACAKANNVAETSPIHRDLPTENLRADGRTDEIGKSLLRMQDLSETIVSGCLVLDYGILRKRGHLLVVACPASGLMELETTQPL